MSNNVSEQKDNSEYRFISEKIIAKKKSRLKKLVIYFIGTVILAVLFGVVARFAFFYSEPAVFYILGISPTPTPTTVPKQPVLFPSGEIDEDEHGAPDSTQGPSATEDPAVTPDDSPSPTEAAAVDESTPTPELDVPDATVIPTVTPIIIIQNSDATIDDYISMYKDIRGLATTVKKSLLTVKSIVSNVDWFDETYITTTTTTGLVLGDNGIELLLLVNYERISEATKISVMINRIEYEAELISMDSDFNLAVIGVELDKIPEMELSKIEPANMGESYSLIVGTPILAVGSPNGYPDSFVTGMVTSKDVYVYITDNKLELFVTDVVADEPGDGVIVNMQGQIIGLITNLYTEGTDSICKAIGISRIKPIIEKLANNADISYFGILAEEVPSDVLMAAGLTNGIYVREVMENSPAAESGIKKGDIITHVGTAKITSMYTFMTLMQNSNVNDVIVVKLQRAVQQAYKEMNFSVRITAK